MGETKMPLRQNVPMGMHITQKIHTKGMTGEETVTLVLENAIAKENPARLRMERYDN